MLIFITAHAAKDLRGLPAATQDRILSKLIFYRGADNPLAFAKKLHGGRFGGYRLRIGEYRAIFDLVGGEIHILAIELRKDAY